MRDTPKGIVEELRFSAQLDAEELGDVVENMPQTEAADYIEHLSAALERIAQGEADPVHIAVDALDTVKWMRGGKPSF